MALPGSGKTFDQFREDDYYCKQYANEQVGGQTPNKASIASGLGSAAVGNRAGCRGRGCFRRGSGAAIGAGSGLLVGGLVGTGTASASGNIEQQRYDIGYTNACTAKVIMFLYQVKSWMTPSQSAARPALPTSIRLSNPASASARQSPASALAIDLWNHRSAPPT